MNVILFAYMVLVATAAKTCYDCAKNKGQCFDYSKTECMDSSTYNEDCVKNLKYKTGSYDKSTYYFYHTCNTLNSSSISFYKDAAPATKKIAGD